ncbi:unnamed protein product [Thelazia callipaeda]|uniref:Signal recognition particle receptor subunit beta n=1 Tax=Thelazia callipaeda TaxID=103827 RepID=A0A0N5D3L2_THECL|nr:unnamed protein product [Thelazia callipaeda]
MWIRERSADKFRGIFYDPAVGREVLFEEKQKVKGKASLQENVKKRFNLTIESIFGSSSQLFVILHEMEGLKWTGFADYFEQQTWVTFLITLLVILIPIIAYIVKKKFSRGDTVLITGLCDSGKTVLFSKLINPKYSPDTFASLKENVHENFQVAEKLVTIVDFPGSEKLRRHLFENYFEKNQNKLRGIIFLVDSSTFSKKARDVAAFLYDILYESDKKIPILVACNKQDCPFAKSALAVRTALEREFGYINGTRGAALDSIDGITKKRTLTTTGKNFQWKDLAPRRLDFVECCAKEENESKNSSSLCQIEAVQTWIATL